MKDIAASHKLAYLFSVLIVIIIYLVVMIGFSKIKFGGNISGFFYIGDVFPAKPLWTDKTFIHHGYGYDGQFYYYIAHDPFIRTDIYKFIDSPAYRYQRIAYPLLASILSFGHRPLLPYTFVLLNILAVGGGVYCVARICKLNGISPWYSLFYGISVGLLFSNIRALVEPLEMFFIVLGIYLYLKGRLYTAALTFASAALAKETAIFVPLSLGLYRFVDYLYKRLKDDRSKGLMPIKDASTILENIVIFGLPLIVVLTWQLYIYKKFYVFPYQQGPGNIGIPFKGLLDKSLNLTLAGIFNGQSILEAYLVALIIFTMFVAIINGIADQGDLSILCAVYAIFVSLYTYSMIWVSVWSYGRVTIELFTITIIYFIITKKRILLIPLIGNSAAFWLAIYELMQKNL